MKLYLKSNFEGNKFELKCGKGLSLARIFTSNTSIAAPIYITYEAVGELQRLGFSLKIEQTKPQKPPIPPIAARFRDFRSKNNLSIEAMAVKIGVSIQKYKRLESGSSFCMPEYLEKLGAIHPIAANKPAIATNKFAKLIAKYEKAYTDSWFCDVLKLEKAEFADMKSGQLGVSDAVLNEFTKTLQDETVAI